VKNNPKRTKSPDRHHARRGIVLCRRARCFDGIRKLFFQRLFLLRGNAFSRAYWLSRKPCFFVMILHAPAADPPPVSAALRQHPKHAKNFRRL